MKIKLTSNLTEWNKIKKRLLTNSDKELQIGFFAEDFYGADNNDMNVAHVAAIVEQGTPFSSTGNFIPPRPFMRVGLANLLKSAPYRQEYRNSFLRILKGKSTTVTEYARLGEVVAEDLKDVIREWRDPPNAKLTVDLKGFNDPLIETGLMLNSVKFKVRKSRKRK